MLSSDEALVDGEKEKVEDHSLKYSCGERKIPSPLKIYFFYIYCFYSLAAGCKIQLSLSSVFACNLGSLSAGCALPFLDTCIAWCSLQLKSYWLPFSV